MYRVIYSDHLEHHGILGQKWGVQNGPPYPLSAEDRSKAEQKFAKSIKAKEKKAIRSEYKRSKKAGGGYVFPMFRTSTGENYNRLVKEYNDRLDNDKKYETLSKKAFDAEKKRLLYEKKLGDKEDPDDVDELLRLQEESMAATKAKDDYVKKIASEYISIVKDAKIKDLNITENIEEAKKFISSKFDDYYWDENREFNPDSYYEEGIENEEFHYQK